MCAYTLILILQVLNGTVYSSGFEGSKTTSSGHNLSLSAASVSFSGGSSANIVTSDIPIQNGVMHIIDTVLTDTEKTSDESSGGIRGITLRGVIAIVAGAGAIYVAI